MLTLHEAIEQVLKENGRPMSCSEIAKAVADKKLYYKGDGDFASSNQISARVSKYPLLFRRENGKIYILNWK